MLLTRRAARGAHGAERRADPARRAGSRAVGSRADRRGQSRWCADALAQRRRSGRTRSQAAIAAVHDEAPTVEDTDWPQILALYDAAEAHVRQSDGDAQPRDRGGDGARAGRGARRCSRRSTPTRGSRDTTGSTPCARTCTSAQAIASGRSRTSGRRRMGRGVGRSAIILVPRYLCWCAPLSSRPSASADRRTACPCRDARR